MSDDPKKALNLFGICDQQLTCAHIFFFKMVRVPDLRSPGTTVSLKGEYSTILLLLMDLVERGSDWKVMYLEHSLREVSVEESNHLLHIGAALGSHCDHVAISKPGT